MSVQAAWQPYPLLLLAALLALGCEQPTIPESDGEPGEPVLSELAPGRPTPAHIRDLRREVLRRYKDELWPCPGGYVPIQIDEYVPTAPPPKLPGDPEYWNACPALPGYATNHNSSVATASHLGRVTNEWDACLDFNTFTGFFDARLTAADGDELDWDVTAVATPLPGGGLYSETTDISFVGGTGRFANATGYAAGAGQGVPSQGEYLFYVGCLAY